MSGLGPARDTARCDPTGVCLVTGEFPPAAGGVGDYTLRLAGALASERVRVQVLTRRTARPAGWAWGPASKPAGSERAAPLDAIRVRREVVRCDARAWPLAVRALREAGQRPILHIQFQAGAYDLGGWVHLLPLVVRARVSHARVVTTFHDFRPPYLFPKAGPVRLAANRLLARTSHAAIFAESEDRQAAGRGVRGFEIPIGSNVDPLPAADFDRAWTRRRLGADDRTVLVGYFGFLNSSKGVPTLLEAVSRLVAGGQPARLAIIGGPVGSSDPTDLIQAREFRDSIARLGLSGRIEQTGYLDPSDLSAALLACDLVALPFRDGASLRRGTLMAAIAHGVPIVTTARPGGRPGGPLRLVDGQQALLVPPDDAEALARAIMRLAEDDVLRARLRAGARALAEQIAWPTIARATLRVYQAVLEDRSAARSAVRARGGAKPATGAGVETGGRT